MNLLYEVVATSALRPPPCTPRTPCTLAPLAPRAPSHPLQPLHPRTPRTPCTLAPRAPLAPLAPSHPRTRHLTSPVPHPYLRISVPPHLRTSSHHQYLRTSLGTITTRPTRSGPASPRRAGVSLGARGGSAHSSAARSTGTGGTAARGLSPKAWRPRTRSMLTGAHRA